MGLAFWRKPEERATNITNEAGVSTSDPRSAELFGVFGMDSVAGVAVNIETAMGVPAIWDATNFLSGTLAGLPLNGYRRSGNERTKLTGPMQALVHDDVNDEMSSFEWRKYTFEQVLTGGRAFSYIERNSSGTPINIWPLEPARVKIKRVNNRKQYIYRSDARTITYESSEIIDIPFMLKADGLTHRGPIASNRDVIGLAIASVNYASRFFQNGGVPPFVVTGGFQGGGAMKRAADDLEAAVKKATKDARQALVLPNGLEIKQIGADPEKSQLVEVQKFLIEQIARIYAIPPTFLQDLSHGTFSNTEQQDLHFVKHTVKRWAEQFEAEMNLKLFGRGRNTRFVEMNMDGLLRGDFKTRMDGNSSAIQTGQLTPNEARAMENRPAMPNGDDLLIQGATVPLGTQEVGGENAA